MKENTVMYIVKQSVLFDVEETKTESVVLRRFTRFLIKTV